jgi:hypothetical protein
MNDNINNNGNNNNGNNNNNYWNNICKKNQLKLDIQNYLKDFSFFQYISENWYNFYYYFIFITHCIFTILTGVVSFVTYNIYYIIFILTFILVDIFLILITGDCLITMIEEKYKLLGNMQIMQNDEKKNKKENGEKGKGKGKKNSKGKAKPNKRHEIIKERTLFLIELLVTVSMFIAIRVMILMLRQP